MAVSPFLCNLHAGSVPSSLRESPTHALPFLSFSPSIIAETVTFCQRAGREEGPRKHFRVLPDANHHAPLIMQREDHQSFSPSTASCLLMEDAESKSGEAFSCSTEDERSASRRSSFESKTDAKVDDERTDHSGGEQVSRLKEIESMKERLSKLLLGEDMSGCGKGVCTALAISNAVTNLCATVFGQLWRLEPLPPEKKSRWRREMEWLLCVSDHIVEFKPTLQTFPDGSKLEVMTCRPRPDLYINLPALRKLDNMLLEILDSFSDPEFWYVDQGTMASDSDSLASFRRRIHQQGEKWWLPVPRVPAEGLRESTRKQLQHQRVCAKQILKASVAINSSTLAEMEVPDSYFDSLPKNLRASMGETMYSYITSEQFSPHERLLDCLDLSSEHQALEIANRIEASIHVWCCRRRSISRSHRNGTTRSSWGIVRGMAMDAEKSRVFASRAESILLCLKQRFPGLTQTNLDVCKIQFNKDVGKSILESYSRVLESLAFNIVARIDELLYVDGFSKCAKISFVDHHQASCRHSVPGFDTACSTPSFSPATVISPAREERFVIINSKSGMKKILTSYLNAQAKGKNSSKVIERAEFPCMKAGAQGSGKLQG